MYQRGNQDIAWDAENRPVSVTQNGTTAYYWYNRYFEVNLSTSTNTSYYYLGSSLIAMSVNSTLRYVHQDHLTGTSVVSDSAGSLISSIKYTPFGETRAGDVPTDKKFTGQRLDSTGLYYYNARYYDPTIGRFISADPFMLRPSYPQGLNRYSYVFNNPLRYTDPTGNWPPWDQIKEAGKKLIDKAKDGLEVAKTKAVEIKQTVEERYKEVKYAISNKINSVPALPKAPEQPVMPTEPEPVEPPSLPTSGPGSNGGDNQSSFPTNTPNNAGKGGNEIDWGKVAGGFFIM
jgi:RHS repeat-associated protein